MDKQTGKDILNGIIAVGCAGLASFTIIYCTHYLTKKEETVAVETAAVETKNVYTGTADSPSPYGGDLTVQVTVDDEGSILKVEVLDNNATEGIGTKAIDALPDMIVAAQSTNVDSVSGASITSAAIIEAVDDALSQMNAEKEAQ